MNFKDRLKQIVANEQSNKAFAKLQVELNSLFGVSFHWSIGSRDIRLTDDEERQWPY